MGVWLTLKQRGPDRLEYSVALAQRLTFGLIFVLILTAILTTAPRVFAGTNTFALIMAAVALLATIYDEAWVFDRGSGHCMSRLGVLGAVRCREVPLAGITALRLVNTTQAPRRSLVALVIVVEDGRPLKVDMVRGVAVSRLKDAAAEIARFCEVPLEEE